MGVGGGGGGGGVRNFSYSEKGCANAKKMPILCVWGVGGGGGGGGTGGGQT